MIDTSDALRDFLLDQPTLVALTDTRIWAEMDTPPARYKPADGQAICFRRRGGGFDEEAVSLFPSYQFKLYGEEGGVNSAQYSANELYQVLFDVLNVAGTYLVKRAELETQGQTLQEPDTGWWYVLVFYKLHVLN